MLFIYRISHGLFKENEIEVVKVYFDLEKVSLVLGRIALVVFDNVEYFRSQLL